MAVLSFITITVTVIIIIIIIIIIIVIIVVVFVNQSVSCNIQKACIFTLHFVQQLFMPFPSLNFRTDH